jgi:hypothetical protein
MLLFLLFSIFCFLFSVSPPICYLSFFIFHDSFGIADCIVLEQVLTVFDKSHKKKYTHGYMHDTTLLYSTPLHSTPSRTKRNKKRKQTPKKRNTKTTTTTRYRKKKKSKEKKSPSKQASKQASKQ